MARRRTSAGRQRIAMRRIDNEEARHICFSKRRMGLFKKACDLSTLTGAEIAIIVFSPAGKAYSFGSPVPDTVINRFLTGGRAPSGPSRGCTMLRELNGHCTELMERLKAAKLHKTMLEGCVNALAGESYLCAWASDVDSLGLSELEYLAGAMENVKGRADMRIAEILTAGASTSMAVNQHAGRMIYPFNPIAVVPTHPGANLGYVPKFY